MDSRSVTSKPVAKRSPKSLMIYGYGHLLDYGPPDGRPPFQQFHHVVKVEKNGDGWKRKCSCGEINCPAIWDAMNHIRGGGQDAPSPGDEDERRRSAVEASAQRVLEARRKALDTQAASANTQYWHDLHTMTRAKVLEKWGL